MDDNGTPGDPSDDWRPVYVSGDKNANGIMEKNEVWLFTSAGVRTFSAPAGLYGNKATVTARDPQNKVVTDDDLAFLYGTVVNPTVKKYVNGQDADTAPGALVVAGSTVTWTYTVTNGGNIAIAVELWGRQRHAVEPGG